MNTDRMSEIAARLGELYKDRAGCSLAEWIANKGLERRMLELTPLEGWPGKNEELRATAREKAFGADEQISTLRADAFKAKGDLLDIEGDIEALEAERRALEWQVRARLVEALERGHVQSNHRGDRAETAFDDGGDHKVDRAIFHETSAEMMAPVDDDLPF